MNKLLILLVGVLLVSYKSSVNEVSKSATEELVKPTKPNETEVWKPKLKVVTVDRLTGIPSDAIILFDGSDFDEWVSASNSGKAKWILNSDKSMTVKNKAGDIKTKRDFGDIELHIEWKSLVEVKGVSQHRANSGVFIQSRYEVQVLDNNDNDTYADGQVGSIYKQSIPLAKASSKTGDRNVYDIIYHAPEFNKEGGETKSATITVLHNGVLIQDYYQIIGTTEFIG